MDGALSIGKTVPGQQARNLAGESSTSSSRGRATAQPLEIPTSTARIGAAAGLLGAFGLGAAFKDGINSGFTRIGHFTNAISNVISVPFSLLFPFFIVDNERASRRAEKRSKDDLFNRMVYTAASLGFTPNTWGDPLMMGTRSKAHKAATLLNLPHMVFTLFSYTGGRFLGFLTAVKKRLNRDPIRNFRLEQEFDAQQTLGNIGSAQAAVIPQAGQFILGWETIKDVFTGNFGSAWDRFKQEPISVTLGTLFNSWMWPFDYLAKFFDTTMLTAENVEQFENAFPKNSFIISFLKKRREGWYNATQDPNSILGKCLKFGREASKIEALLIPPIGMVSVVAPVFNKFLRGNFFNKEAQEIGGTIGLLDKVFSMGAFFSHIYYTGVYTASVRLPQTVTSGAFYLTHLYNKARGVEPGQKGYKDPIDVRDAIFNRSFINRISNWAAGAMNKIEKELHKDPGDQQLVTKDANGNFTEGRSRHIRNFAQVMAQEVCYQHAREFLYSRTVEDEFFDPGIGGIKKKGLKPSDIKWGEILEANKEQVLEKANFFLRQYLERSLLLDKEKQTVFMEREYPAIRTEIEELLKGEIEGCKMNTTKPKEEQEIKSKSFLELLTNWKELKKVLTLKTFHVANTILPLWVRGFVNVVDFGKKDDPFWLRNLKATETGRREGDVIQACNREFMPVVGYAFQSMGKGLAIIWNLFHGRLPQLAEE